MDPFQSTQANCSIDEVYAMVNRLGPGTLLNKIDLKNVFHLIPIRRQDWNPLGICWQGKYHIEVLPVWMLPVLHTMCYHACYSCCVLCHNVMCYDVCYSCWVVMRCVTVCGTTVELSQCVCITMCCDACFNCCTVTTRFGYNCTVALPLSHICWKVLYTTKC